MTLSMFDLSVPPFVRGLATLSQYLANASEYAAAKGIEPTDLINARLAPDMLPLSGQIQRASDTSKGTIGRLTDIPAPSFADTETTLAELQDRIAKTVAFLRTVTPEHFTDAANKKIELKFLKTTLSGKDYVLQFALPNFYFHVATAHAILRHNGLKIGKLDYLGTFE